MTATPNCQKKVRLTLYINQNFANIIQDVTMAKERHHDTFCNVNAYS